MAQQTMTMDELEKLFITNLNAILASPTSIDDAVLATQSLRITDPTIEKNSVSLSEADNNGVFDVDGSFTNVTTIKVDLDRTSNQFFAKYGLISENLSDRERIILNAAIKKAEHSLSEAMKNANNVLQQESDRLTEKLNSPISPEAKRQAIKRISEIEAEIRTNIDNQSAIVKAGLNQLIESLNSNGFPVASYDKAAAILTDFDATVATSDGFKLNEALIESWRKAGIRDIYFFSTMNNKQFGNELDDPDMTYTRANVIKLLKDAGFNVKFYSPIDILTQPDSYYEQYAKYIDFVRKNAPENLQKGDIRTWLETTDDPKFNEVKAWLKQSATYDKISTNITAYHSYFELYDEVINGKLQLTNKADNEKFMALYQELEIALSPTPPKDPTFTDKKIEELYLFLNHKIPDNHQFINQDIKKLFEQNGGNLTLDPNSREWHDQHAQNLEKLKNYADTKAGLFEVVTKDNAKTVDSLAYFDDKHDCLKSVSQAKERLKALGRYLIKTKVVPSVAFQDVKDNPAKLEAGTFVTFDFPRPINVDKATESYKKDYQQQYDNIMTKFLEKKPKSVKDLATKNSVILALYKVKQDYAASGSTSNSKSIDNLIAKCEEVNNKTNISAKTRANEMMRLVEKELLSLRSTKAKTEISKKPHGLIDKVKQKINKMYLSRHQFNYPKLLAKMLNEQYISHPEFKAQSLSANSKTELSKEQYKIVKDAGGLAVELAKELFPILNDKAIQKSDIQEVIDGTKTPQAIVKQVEDNISMNLLNSSATSTSIDDKLIQISNALTALQQGALTLSHEKELSFSPDDLTHHFDELNKILTVINALNDFGSNENIKLSNREKYQLSTLIDKAGMINESKLNNADKYDAIVRAIESTFQQSLNQDRSLLGFKVSTTENFIKNDLNNKDDKHHLTRALGIILKCEYKKYHDSTHKTTKFPPGKGQANVESIDVPKGNEEAYNKLKEPFGEKVQSVRLSMR